jgi:hypothetical protein
MFRKRNSAKPLWLVACAGRREQESMSLWDPYSKIVNAQQRSHPPNNSTDVPPEPSAGSNNSALENLQHPVVEPTRQSSKRSLVARRKDQHFPARHFSARHEPV